MDAPPSSEFSDYIAAVRRFNRFYTRQIGILQKGYLGSPFSLAEVRVIYELAQRDQTTASALNSELGLDPGYLSRLLRNIGKRGLIQRTPSPHDGRQSLLALTEQGRAEFATYNARSDADIGALLEILTPPDQARLVKAMAAIEHLLGAAPPASTPYLLRPHQSGDMGWIVQQHGLLYAREYAWDERFEGLVAGIAAGFIEHFNRQRERCWIAEIDGEPVGSVMLVEKSAAVAKLRLLLVLPQARGFGIGRRLVDECSRFARQAGYRKIILWTNSVLVAARRIYQQAGYRLIESEPHHSFGQDLVGETWELVL